LTPAVFAAAVAAAMLAVHIIPGRSAHAAGDCTVTASEAALDAEERAFLTLINNYRVQNGRQPLKISYYLTRPSAWKSKHLGVNAYFAHDDIPINRPWYTRVEDCGYTYPTGKGENIAAGYTTAAHVFSGWQGSPGHNANMLGSGYTAIGIGRHFVSGSPYGWYWTTVFGGVDDGWYNAPESVTAVGSVQPLGWQPSGQQLGPPVTTGTALPHAGIGGAPTRPWLDFSRICQSLTQRRHPLAVRFCGPPN
jgi:uncharacterized protein YkwD